MRRKRKISFHTQDQDHKENHMKSKKKYLMTELVIIIMKEPCLNSKVEKL